MTQDGRPGAAGLDVDTLSRRIGQMRQIVEDLRSLGAPTPEVLEEDRLTRYAVERMLSLVVELAVGVNAHAAARRLGRGPGDARESFELAAEAGLITPGLASALKPSVGLRNLLTHEYLRVDLGIVAASVPLAIDGYGEYVRQVARALGAST